MNNYDDRDYVKQFSSMRNSHNHMHGYSHSHKFQLLFTGNIQRIVDYFDVNRATAYRWIKAGKPTNPTALRLLDIAASGFLPCSNAWDGYMIIDNRIITPNGYDVLPSELDLLARNDMQRPTADRIINRPRNFKPWCDREPEFVKGFKK